MGQKADTAKGLIRGLTADWLGGPVDLATIVANLGIAGGGYAAHKLGFIDTPPDLLDPKNVPFSSDWHVKNSPLENTGTAGYAAGQFTGNILPGIGSFAKGMAAPRKGQTNALYPGGSDEFLLGHTTSAESLLPQAGKPELRKELYHPSWGITKNSPPPAFGGTYVIPDPKKFEPKTSPTVIRAGDFYSPRYADSKAGGGVDKYLDKWQNHPEVAAAKNARKYYADQMKRSDVSADEFSLYEEKLSNLTRYIEEMQKINRPTPELAQKRLSDRFDPRFPKGGLWGEGTGSSSSPPEPSITNFHKLREDLSPRFQGFKHFAESPYGGSVVDKGKGDLAINLTDSLSQKADQVLDRIALRGVGGKIEPANQLPPSERIQLMKGLAGEGRGKNLLWSPDYFNWEEIDPSQYREVAKFFQTVFKKLKTAPTSYAEAKTFGPVGVNPDNIAGIISREGGTLGQLLAEAAKKRGIPYVQTDLSASDDAVFRAAVSMQNNALYRGMGGR